MMEILLPKDAVEAFLAASLVRIEKSYSKLNFKSEFYHLWKRMAYSVLGHLRGNSTMYPESGNDRALWPNEIDQLRIMGWNTRNFIIEKHNHVSGNPNLKLDAKLADYRYQARNKDELREMATMIQRLNPDFVVLEEVHLPSIRDFVASHLQGQYRVEGVSGNTPFGIVLLIKSSLPIFVKVMTHKNDHILRFGKGSVQMKIFTQDFPLFLIFRDRPGVKRQHPDLVLAGSHFKALRLQSNSADRGQQLHQAQRDRSIAIMHKFAADFSNLIPTFVMGDLNMPLGQKEAEDFLLQLGFENPRDSLPKACRVTFDHAWKTPQTQAKEFDFIFGNPTAAGLVTKVHPSCLNEGDNGDELEQALKLNHDSDHRPILLDIKVPTSFVD